LPGGVWRAVFPPPFSPHFLAMPPPKGDCGNISWEVPFFFFLSFLFFFRMVIFFRCRSFPFFPSGIGQSSSDGYDYSPSLPLFPSLSESRVECISPLFPPILEPCLLSPPFLFLFQRRAGWGFIVGNDPGPVPSFFFFPLLQTRTRSDGISLPLIVLLFPRGGKDGSLPRTFFFFFFSPLASKEELERRTRKICGFFLR